MSTADVLYAIHCTLCGGVMETTYLETIREKLVVMHMPEHENDQVTQITESMIHCPNANKR